MTPHPHAEVLRAIADGVPPSEFEITWGAKVSWITLESGAPYMFIDSSEIRRKSQHIMVNWFKVPKPLDVAPEHLEQFFYPEFAESDLSDSDTWQNHMADKNRLRAGVCHATKEAAIAHAKAMLGIDPEYFK